MKAAEDFPTLSVQPTGPARHRVDGAREQDYIDDAGDRWTCVTNGCLYRRWHRQPVSQSMKPALCLVPVIRSA